MTPQSRLSIVNQNEQFTHSVDVLDDVLESRMREKLCEEGSLVEHCVDEIRIVMKRVDETRIEDFQHHPHHFLDDG